MLTMLYYTFSQSFAPFDPLSIPVIQTYSQLKENCNNDNESKIFEYDEGTYPAISLNDNPIKNTFQKHFRYLGSLIVHNENTTQKLGFNSWIIQ